MDLAGEHVLLGDAALEAARGYRWILGEVLRVRLVLDVTAQGHDPGVGVPQGA
jgi:hypothetical protein